MTMAMGKTITMTKTVFILTMEEEKENKIKSILEGEYEIRLVTKGNIMMELIKTPPLMIIADIDSYGEQLMDFIRTIISIEYIPVLYITKENFREKFNLQNEIFLSIDKINDNVQLLIKQAEIFKGRYSNLSESYNAIDIINRTVNKLLKGSSTHEGEGSEHQNIILNLIDEAYGENIFLTNKPREIWSFIRNENKYLACQFVLENNKYNEKLKLNFDVTDGFKFNINGENGFSKNYNGNELSDISFNERIFPTAIKAYVSNLNNFAGYSIGNIILIGMNFSGYVTNQDVDIMKALAINFDMVATIHKQVNELEASFNYTMDALARAAEANDDVTGHHIKRVNLYSKLLSEEMGMDQEFINKIENAAQMHDVGKIYVDKAILTKPGKLTEEEFQIIKKHTLYGEKIIGDSLNLKMAAEVAKNHHERYDGGGYPEHKVGEQIPISARIVNLADIYDALRSERPYKKSFTHEEAFRIITEGDGRVEPKHFDPEVLNAFKNIHQSFNKVYESFKD